jgi:hypothetical protein
MDKTQESLTLNDVCALLRACSEARVTELKFGTLQVLFAPAEMGREQLQPMQDLVQPSAADIDSSPEAREAFANEVRRTKQERLALMAVEDPAELERLILSGDLTDDDPDADYGAE